MRGFYPSQSSEQISVQSPSPPLGPVMATLSEDDLANCPDLYEHSASIVCCEDVASYNWLNEKEPTILIPGLNALSRHLAVLE